MSHFNRLSLRLTLAEAPVLREMPDGSDVVNFSATFGQPALSPTGHTIRSGILSCSIKRRMLTNDVAALCGVAVPVDFEKWKNLSLGETIDAAGVLVVSNNYFHLEILSFSKNDK